MRRFRTILKEFKTTASVDGIHADFPLLDVFKKTHNSFESLMKSVFGSKGMQKYFIEEIEKMQNTGDFVKKYEKKHKELKLITAQEPMAGNENEWLKMFLFENVLRTIHKKIDIRSLAMKGNSMGSVIKAIDEVYKKYKDKFDASPKRTYRHKRRG